VADGVVMVVVDVAVCMKSIIELNRKFGPGILHNLWLHNDQRSLIANFRQFYLITSFSYFIDKYEMHAVAVGGLIFLPRTSC
jgi:hypothetical protein